MTTELERCSIENSLTSLLSPNLLSSIAWSFVELTGDGFGFIDSSAMVIIILNPNQDFCDLFSGDDRLKGGCEGLKNNLALFHERTIEARNLASDSITCHSCPLGFSYAVKSILVEGETSGYCVFGPYLPQDYTLPPDAGSIGEKGGVTKQQFESFYKNLTHLTVKEVEKKLNAFHSITGIIVENAHRLSLAGQMQFLSMEENYRILLEKNRELEETKIRLEELDRIKSNILSTISHELRTPLTSIIGYSEMLLGKIGGNLTKEQEKFITTINDKGGQLLETINEILDVASIEAGRLEVARQNYPIKEILLSAIDRVRKKSTRGDVKIEAPLPDSDLLVYVDPVSIEKALFQVIENAVKFSPFGGVVQVQVRKVSPDMVDGDAKGFVIMAPTMKSIEVMIRDFGPGIPNGLKDKIFEPFYQVDSSSTREHGGIGLGLALVKHYIWANGGKIRLESQPDEGSTFYITLPEAG